MSIYTYMHESENLYSDDAVNLAEAAIQSVLNESLRDARKKFADEVMPELSDAAKNAGRNLRNAAFRTGITARHAANDVSDFLSTTAGKTKEAIDRSAEHAQNRKLARQMASTLREKAKRLDDLEKKFDKVGSDGLTGKELKELRQLRKERKAAQA